MMAQALCLHGLGLLETLRGRNAGRMLQGLQLLLQRITRALLGRRIGEVGTIIGLQRFRPDTGKRGHRQNHGNDCGSAHPASLHRRLPAWTMPRA
ncbi:hypothetical protein G6F63_015807 [Rhizopus arrhizus]|nr:hypothetical protein G6F63_015807 [Rhizopus arrhizus]KAG1389071.1 hypothetical protein G6F58_013375 [Rhizopus delemar]